MEIWLQGLGADFFSVGVAATIDDRAAFSGGETLMADCATARIDTSHVNDVGFDFDLTSMFDCGIFGTMGHVRPIRSNSLIEAEAIPTSAVYFAELCYEVPDDASGEATINCIATPTGIGDGNPVVATTRSSGA